MPMEESTISKSLVDKLAESFRYYSNTVYSGRSELYVNLAMRVAEDIDLLKIAAQGSEKNALPNLFFASIHLLLLKGEKHQLAAFYPSLNDTTRHYDYVYPYFRSFVLEHELEIRDLLSTRSVQTNEVARCAILVPAFELVAQQARGRALAMIEIGSSAGLTLLWDHYHYQYGRNLQCGPPNSPVQIECELRGAIKPPVPDEFPKIKSRQGIDLNPLDLRDPESILWLRALVWPEHQRRAEQLERAVEIARDHPPKMTRGDALELLPKMMDGVEADAQLCVYHSFTLSLANKGPREKLESILTQVSRKREVFWVSFEWARNTEIPLLEMSKFEKMVKTGKKLAMAQAHGEWLEWLSQE